jgi:hypothetical protein
MYTRDKSQPFDARLEGRGFYAAGTAGVNPTPVEGDSPTEGTVDGPLAPEPLPGGLEQQPDSEMRPRENDPRTSDGVEEFKRMEENAEDGRE